MAVEGTIVAKEVLWRDLSQGDCSSPLWYREVLDAC